MSAEIFFPPYMTSRAVLVNEVSESDVLREFGGCEMENRVGLSKLFPGVDVRANSTTPYPLADNYRYGTGFHLGNLINVGAESISRQDHLLQTHHQHRKTAIFPKVILNTFLLYNLKNTFLYSTNSSSRCSREQLADYVFGTLCPQTLRGIRCQNRRNKFNSFEIGVNFTASQYFVRAFIPL